MKRGEIRRTGGIVFLFSFFFLGITPLLAKPGPTAEHQKALKDSLRSDNGNAFGKGYAPASEEIKMRLSGNGHVQSLHAPAGSYFEIKSKVPGDPESSVKRFLLQEHPDVFGLTSSKVDFALHRQKEMGEKKWIRLQQTYQSLPVFGAEVNVQLQAADSGVEFVLSDILADTDSLDSGEVSLQAKLAGKEAGDYAIASLNREYPAHTLKAEGTELMIYSPSVIGADGPVALVWKIKVISTDGPWVEEICLVSALTGETLLHYTLLPEARNRMIYDSNNTTANPGTLRRSEGGAAYGVQDVDDAYDYLGWVYNFYSAQNGRDSIDNAGMTMKATTRYCKPGYACPYANAYWSGTYQQMFFGQGYTKDDITGHEMTHGVTEKESGLIYSYQSGAINESLSDMWGEWIDLSNHGTHDNDDAANRWLMGEDIGAIRDMSDPPAYGDPDKMSSPNWYSGSGDYGGVHTNSGVGNKLCYLLTDGDSFNGHTVYGMGIANVTDLMYEAQIDLLTSGSDYADLYDALVQAAINIGWDAAEKANLEQACLAVEISSGTTPVDPYCTAGSNNSNYEYISRVQVGTIDNSTGRSGYTSYTAISTQMKIGTGYPITVTNGSTSYPGDQCGVWIDWNNDKDFEDAGETIAMTGSPGVGPYTATITPPAGALLVNTRMRVRIMYTGTPSPCGFTSYGEVEDYTITVKGLCQASGGGWEYISGVEIGTISNTGTDASGYTDYAAMSATIGVGQSLPITVTNGQPYSGDQCGIWVDWNHNDEFTDAGEKITVIGTPGLGPYTALITPPSGAALGSTRIRVRIGYIGALEPCGNYTYGEVEDYRLYVMDYCDASATNSAYMHISRMQVGDIDNASGPTSYTDYTFLSTVMSLGQAYPAIVTNGSTLYSASQCGIWVDWNQDRDFTDAGETVTITNTPGVGPYTGTINVPLYAQVGPTRMRVRIMYTGTVSPCGTTSYGEVEDYTVVVQECPKPSNPHPADGDLNVPITTSLSWNGGSGFVLDNFNRLNSTDMGANWSEQAGDFSIFNNIATSTNSSLMTWQGVEPGQRLSVDVIQNGGSGVQYVAIISGYADLNNCVFIKVQGTTQFTHIGFYYGNNGSNTPAWSNSAFISLTTPFTTARMTTILEGDTVTLLLDTNFDGIVDQSYTRNGLPTQLLGTKAGLGGYGSPLMDNFSVPPAGYSAPFAFGEIPAEAEPSSADSTVNGSDTGALPTEEQMTLAIRKYHAALHGVTVDENNLSAPQDVNSDDTAGLLPAEQASPKTGQVWRAGQEPRDTSVLTANPDEIDITTGLPAQANTPAGIDYGLALPSEKRVLWDLTHGVYLGYEPSVRYSTLVNLLTGQGYTIDTTAAGVENVNLLAYDILVVAVGSSWNSAYTAAEVAEIKAFMNSGGGLLILSDNPSTPSANVSPVSAAFNITSGVSSTTNTITNLSTHPIFTGCSTIAMVATGEITTSLPSTLEAWSSENKGVVAVCSSAGKVVTIGDINFCENTSIGNNNNQAFILNVFNWLSAKLPSAGCMDLGHPTIIPSYYSNISNGDRSVAVDVKSTISVKSIGIMIDIRVAATLNLTIRSISGTTRSTTALATGSASVSPAGARLYSVPVDFTFQKGQRYDIAFDLTEGWGTGIHYMEFYSFDNSSLNPASGYSAGPFTVLDGGLSGGYGNTVMPHIRICSDCRDLGHPTITVSSGTGIGSGDRTVAVEMNSDVTVTSLGVMASVAATGQMIVNIREITGTTAGVILATASRPVTTSVVGFVDIPIEFTFRRGERYAIGFNMNGGWGSAGTQTMEWYSFNNPTLASANAFDIGPFKVLDGGTGTTFSNTLLPHIRACSIGLCPKKYDVYFGTVNPPATLLYSNLTDTTCNPGTLQYLTRYYWKVVVKGECCGIGEGPVWSFRTEPPCLPAANPFPVNGATKVSVHTNLYWSGTAGSGTLFGIRDGFDGFYTIDTITGVPTLIGPSGVTSSTCGLAHSGGDVLYGSRYYGMTVIHLDGSPIEFLGSVGMEGMAYNPSNGKIYGAINGAFFTVNPATGATADTLPNWPDDVEGLEYVPNVGTQGSIFGIDDDGQLHRYDIALNSFSIVGDTGLGASCDNSGLAYAGDLDILYLITKSTGDLYKVNKNTAQTIFVANTGISGGSGFSGLAYGPAGETGGAFAPLRMEWQPSMSEESQEDSDGRPVPTPSGPTSMNMPADNPISPAGRAEFAAAGTTLTKVAIFQDVAPWTSTLNQDILASNGIAYTIFNSSQMGSVTISDFDKVIIPSAQESDTVYEFYTRLEANRAWFEDYVAAGGLLDLHMAAFGDENGRQLPGGFVVTHQTADDIAIVNAAHAILNDPRPIGEAELDGWFYSAHGYISTVPSGATSILKIASTTRPCCMELTFGSGRILITTQTMEWRSGSYNFLENMILYDLPATPSTTYDLYLGKTNPPPLKSVGLTKTHYDPTPAAGQILDSCSTYYWKVIEHDNYCGTLTGPVWSFKTELLCDYDSSGRVNLADFKQFAMHWLETGCISPGWCSGADLNRLDSSVTLPDLIIFSNQWLKICP